MCPQNNSNDFLAISPPQKKNLILVMFMLCMHPALIHDVI